MSRYDGLVQSCADHNLVRVHLAVTQYAQDAQPLLVGERLVDERHALLVILVVRRADELGLMDEADVYVGGIAKSTLLVDLATVKEIRVREVAYTKHEPESGA